MQSLKSKKDVIEEAWQTKKIPSHRRRHHRRHRGPPRHRLVALRRAPPKDHSVALWLPVGALVQCLPVVACGRLG